MFNTDTQLVRRCLGGRPEAFDALYRRYAPRVFRLLRQLTQNASEAEDLTQETFIAAYRALQGWRHEGAFSTWLCGIAYRQYSNSRRERSQDWEPLDTHLELPAPDSDPLIHCTRLEREQRIEKAIGELPAACREVFVLVKVEGLAYREASQVLALPMGTVKSRLWRAVRLLQIALAVADTAQESAHSCETAGTSEPAVRPDNCPINSAETQSGGTRYVL